MEPSRTDDGNLGRIAETALALPEAARVDIEAWEGEPTFRVRGKNFVFTNPEGSSISVKLPKDEAVAVTASDPAVKPSGYGLGRHGWVQITLSGAESDERWEQIAEWIRISYTLVAPKSLARRVDPASGAVGPA